ncbi:MAG TPA: alpha/beta hydrolase domain-containing protein [Streptosporangiaceae bacterium]|nr:alpha/beta hydrolase domain-containing protein [Streptosporangiaceae bacterium]
MSAGPASASLSPIAGRIPDPAGAYDLAALGYVEQEFRLDGTASSYRLTSERTADGRWSAEPAEPAAFATRVLLRQPADDARFSGTVIVEWLNVSGGLDAAPDWMLTHTHLLRRGHAWAGVSAQRAGIEGGGLVPGLHLKAAHPERYAALSHPGDAWSFDIFSQAGRALAALPDLSRARTGTSVPRLLASGHSQSGAFLVTYVNAVDPLAVVYDGFLVHGRTGAGAALDTGFQPGAAGAERIRDDLRVPAIVLQTETDVTLLGSGRVEQPDGDLLRNWELAGAAHADTYLLFASGQDDGALPAARLAELLRPTTDILMGHTEFPVNSGPQHHYVECAAVEHLDAWVAGRAKPPSAPRLQVSAGRDLRRDDLGVATGGIRTPWTDVPAAILSGTGQRGEMFAFLFGTTRELGDADLARLYPGGKADYLGRFESSLDAAIETGFLLGDDRAEALAVAACSWPG